MKERRISRRALIGSAIAGLAQADFLYSTKPFEKNHKLTGDDVRRIHAEAQQLKDRITFENFSSPIIIHGKEGKVTPNPTALTQSLLTLGYLDGGKEAEQEVGGLLRDRGLVIVNREDDSFTKAQLDIPIVGDEPDKLIISQSIIKNYLEELPNPNLDTFWHEFYHFVQHARYPDYFRPFFGGISGLSPTLTAIGVGKYVHAKSIEGNLSRRDALLYSGILGINAGFLMYLSMFYINPYEAQARLQAANGPFRITTNPHTRALGESLLSFDQIKKFPDNTPQYTSEV